MKSRQTRILIVDDDIDDREFLIDAISKVDKDISCIIAVNGPDALLILNEHSNNLPDYIFLDVNMPKMNGNECLKHIKATKYLSDIPVIMYSTTNRAEDIEEAKKNGATDFITKPVRSDLLIKAIKSILSTPLALAIFAS